MTQTQAPFGSPRPNAQTTHHAVKLYKCLNSILVGAALCAHSFAKGLVRRESCPNDRRGSFAVITAEGRALMDETAPHHVAGVRAHFLDQVKPEELAVIATVFARISAAFGPGSDCPGDLQDP